MRQTILLDRILQRAGDVSLADEIVKRLWPIFAREDLVAHRRNLGGKSGRENRKQRGQIYCIGLDWKKPRNSSCSFSSIQLIVSKECSSAALLRLP